MPSDRAKLAIRLFGRNYLPRRRSLLTTSPKSNEDASREARGIPAPRARNAAAHDLRRQHA
jgi:hypothetical protein